MLGSEESQRLYEAAASRPGQPACAQCGLKGDKVMKCGRCRQAFYCCKEHQKRLQGQAAVGRVLELRVMSMPVPFVRHIFEGEPVLLWRPADAWHASRGAPSICQQCFLNLAGLQVLCLHGHFAATLSMASLHMVDCVGEWHLLHVLGCVSSSGLAFTLKAATALVPLLIFLS